MGAGSVADAVPRPQAPTAAGPASTTRASTASTGRTKLGEPGVEHPIIHSTFGYAAQLVVMRPRHRRDRAGASPRTTSAGP